MFDLECDLLRRNRYDLREKALAYESQRSYYEVALAEMGITRTPSEAIDTDLVYYLVREFNAIDVCDFYSKLDGIPHILDVDYLKYRYRLLQGRSDFKDVLTVIIRYLECRKILQGIYDYEREIHVIPRLANTLSKVNLKYKDKPDDDGWYSAKNLKGIDSVYNSLYGEAEGVVSVSSHYYKLFIRVTGYEPEGRNWTFFEGLTRLQELSYLKYVIKGKISPTGVPFIYFAKYLAYLQEGGKPYEELRPYLLEDLKIAVGKLKSLGVYVKAITPYGVYYYDKDKVFEYKRVVTFYCYDYELDEMLPLSNQMNGLGGEFTKDITKSLDGVPYKVRGYKGTRKMYRVGKDTKIRYYNLDFKTSRGILRSMYGNRKVSGMVVITPENKRAIRLELGKIFS